MYWQRRFEREDKDGALKEAILAIRREHPNYGYRRIHAELRNGGHKVNKKRIQRICQELRIQVRSFGRKFRRYSSYKGIVGRIAPNRVNRRFKTNIVHQKITTDTTEFKYYEEDREGKLQVKKLYLDPYMDLYNLEIVSYKISSQPNKGSMLEALADAIEKTQDCCYRRTFHSDRGWAYQMPAYQNLLRQHGIFQSMSRKGNCYDNSPMENFFGILKQEIYYGQVYRSRKELTRAIAEFIQYYNEKRIKAQLNWRSPVQFREEQMSA